MNTLNVAILSLLKIFINNFHIHIFGDASQICIVEKSQF